MQSGKGIVQGLVEVKGHVGVNPQEVTSSGEDIRPVLQGMWDLGIVLY